MFNSAKTSDSASAGVSSPDGAPKLAFRPIEAEKFSEFGRTENAPNDHHSLYDQIWLHVVGPL
jgi:hypothetical protein